MPQEDAVHTAGTGTTDSPQPLRRMNRRQMLLALRDHGPLSRPALSKHTGLSKITVNAVVAELIEEARVDETPHVHTGGPRPRARVVSFKADYAYVAAIDVGATRAQIALPGLAGRIIEQQSADLRRAKNGRELVTVVRSLFQDAVATARISSDLVRALCIATTGIVDPKTQRVLLAPQLPDWDSLDLPTELGDLGDFPIHVENEVRLAVSGEQWRGATAGIDDVAYVHLGVGVGLGLVIGGRIVNGANGAAGEIGYLLLTDQSTTAASGDSGPFERLVGGAAYRRAIERLVESGRGAGCSTSPRAKSQ